MSIADIIAPAALLLFALLFFHRFLQSLSSKLASNRPTVGGSSLTSPPRRLERQRVDGVGIT